MGRARDVDIAKELLADSYGLFEGVYMEDGPIGKSEKSEIVKLMNKIMDFMGDE